eukprot:8563496-Ditylum_brightwellii.AAC.1
MQPIAKGKTGGTISYIKETTSLESPSTYPKTLVNLGFQAECREIHDGDEIMTKLLLRSKLHLNQAWNTPCAKGPLRGYIGDCGLGPGCHDILE